MCRFWILPFLSLFTVYPAQGLPKKFKSASRYLQTNKTRMLTKKTEEIEIICEILRLFCRFNCFKDGRDSFFLYYYRGNFRGRKPTLFNYDQLFAAIFPTPLALALNSCDKIQVEISDNTVAGSSEKRPFSRPEHEKKALRFRHGA